VRIS